jgi:hypothetical protein
MVQVSNVAESGGAMFNEEPKLIAVLIEGLHQLEEMLFMNRADLAAKKLENLITMSIPFLTADERKELFDSAEKVNELAFPNAVPAGSIKSMEDWKRERDNLALIQARYLWRRLMVVLTPKLSRGV